MTKKLNREKQTAVLKKAQEQRKQQKREQVFGAIQHLQSSGQPLTFSNIAQVAGCSVSYLYKWPEVTAYIHDLQNQKAGQFQEIEQKEPGPHSLKTLHEVSKQRIRELEGKNQELKRQNEKLRGHVAEIFELRDECERLRTQLRQLALAEPSSKIVPLHSPSEPTKKPEPKPSKKRSIEEEIKTLGISLNSTLKTTLKAASEKVVWDAIKAYKEALAIRKIERPGGWLKKAIEEGWKPNDSGQAPSEIETFNEWFPIARHKGIVMASQKSKNGIVVCTNKGQWISFAEILKEYPLETL